MGMCSDIMQDVWICHWPMIQNSNWLFDDAENCEDYPVTTNQLKDLKYACQRVVDNPDLAEELLSTYVGFLDSVTMTTDISIGYLGPFQYWTIF